MKTFGSRLFFSSLSGSMFFLKIGGCGILKSMLLSGMRCASDKSGERSSLDLSSSTLVSDLMMPFSSDFYWSLSKVTFVFLTCDTSLLPSLATCVPFLNFTLFTFSLV